MDANNFVREDLEGIEEHGREKLNHKIITNRLLVEIWTVKKLLAMTQKEHVTRSRRKVILVIYNGKKLSRIIFYNYMEIRTCK